MPGFHIICSLSPATSAFDDHLYPLYLRRNSSIVNSALLFCKCNSNSWHIFLLLPWAYLLVSDLSSDSHFYLPNHKVSNPGFYSRVQTLSLHHMLTASQVDLPFCCPTLNSNKHMYLVWLMQIHVRIQALTLTSNREDSR